jgi:hypothetical protein
MSRTGSPFCFSETCSVRVCSLAGNCLGGVNSSWAASFTCSEDPSSRISSILRSPCFIEADPPTNPSLRFSVLHLFLIFLMSTQFFFNFLAIVQGPVSPPQRHNEQQNEPLLAGRCWNVGGFFFVLVSVRTMAKSFSSKLGTRRICSKSRNHIRHPI